MRARTALLLALAAGCVAPGRPAPPPAGASRMFQGSVAAGAEGGFETGRLTSTDEALRGPFVVTFLSAGAEVQLSRTGAGEQVIGNVSGPLAEPIHLAGNVSLRLAGPGEAVYAGYRPMPITRAIEGWLGRQIWLGTPGGQPEQWLLREIGQDHLTVERARTYRVLPVRRIAEITWTDLTGMDPTPRVVLAPE
jgi:hypothetical protein